MIIFLHPQLSEGGYCGLCGCAKCFVCIVLSILLCTVCIWRCMSTCHFCVEVLYAPYVNVHSSIHRKNVIMANVTRRTLSIVFTNGCLQKVMGTFFFSFSFYKNLVDQHCLCFYWHLRDTGYKEQGNSINPLRKLNDTHTDTIVSWPTTFSIIKGF